MSKLLVFGHQNPDMDTIGSAIAMSYLLNNTGKNAEAVALGKPNEETTIQSGQFNWSFGKTDAQFIKKGVTINKNKSQANWGTWKLAYGQISAGGGNIGTPTTPTPVVFNSIITANKRYAISVASGSYKTLVNFVYNKISDATPSSAAIYDVSYTINSIKDTFTATMKLSILP